MKRSFHTLVVIFILAMLIAVPAPERAAAMSRPLPVPPVAGPCQNGTLPGGALWRVCVPLSGWNGDVIVWAHGYVAPNEPLGFRDLTLADGSDLTSLTQRLGFAFATTSYRTNGFVVADGMNDVRELVALLPSVMGQAPRYTYLTGASQGGLIATLLLEQSPELFSGALAVCAPIGDFQRQIDYWGDVRVLFDYFFPEVIPGSPTSIPQEVIDQWGGVVAPAVKAAMEANPNATRQFVSAAQIAVADDQLASAITSTLDLLWYHSTSTNDYVAKLGGNAYDNLDRRYAGSSDDKRLNKKIARITADTGARETVASYQTSGQLAKPLVTLHTTSDPIVPYWHEIAYMGRNLQSATRLVTALPIRRYGHCTFTAGEVMSGFSTLVLRVRADAR